MKQPAYLRFTPKSKTFGDGQIALLQFGRQVIVGEERYHLSYGPAHGDKSNGITGREMSMWEPGRVSRVKQIDRVHYAALDDLASTRQQALDALSSPANRLLMNSLDLARQANSRAMAALRDGSPAIAIRELQVAVANDPKAGPLWRNLAHAYRLCENTAEERAALDNALAIDRTDFAAQLRMAQLLQRIGDEQAAMCAWDGALQLAASIADPTPELARELDAGRQYYNELRNRLADAAQVALALGKADFTTPENRRLTAFINVMLGKQRIYYNECAGPHYPFLPADEFFDECHFPWFAELEAATLAIKAELAALTAEGGIVLRPYVALDEGTPPNKWSGLDRSLDWGACFLYEYGVPNLPVLDACPKTASILERLPLVHIPGRAPNVFFSLLKAGKRIPPHTGVTNTRAIVHLGLDIPGGCGFRVGNENREWVEGRAFAFDDTIEHEAWNDSDRQRAVLILDCWNPHLSQAECEGITRYLTAADAALARP